ncbi:hypothetical protein NET02_15410 [Thermomicrobiaceae bacterium CFH 74404]|uniref:PspA-associated domain-containing protein n=2 Tax=Thermomicrobia TaxID=189775 RepID=A0AA41WG82_9BACT|nr:hypothetical protein [Thermalbibacter longus]MCM8750533.1 hypothetical protein [Thermalbibacter longus]
MIVRISTEGQYRLESTYLDQLNAIDNAVVEAIAANDESRFRTLFQSMLDLVRQHGKPVPPEEFVESDIILPPPDTSFEEARELFAGEGLVPG